MDFHHYPVGSQTAMLGNSSEEDVLEVAIYKLTIRRGNTLLLHDAIYAPGVQVCPLFLVSVIKLGFFFSSHTDGLYILYSGNLFGHVTLKNYFLVLDLDDCYDNNNTSSTFVIL